MQNLGTTTVPVAITTACGGVLEIPPATASHLEAHPEVGGLLTELAGKLALPRDGSFVIWPVEMGRIVGRSGAIAHGGKDGMDEPVTFAIRKGRTIPTRVTIGQGPEVSSLVVVAKAVLGREAEGVYNLLTAYPAAEVAPREPADPNLAPEGLSESLAWWRQNALVHDPKVMGEMFTSTWNTVLRRGV